ncbi:hypothetical protein Mapa_016325 [Marchantia paleacea]|nr:hypothetical protein Mapa_016325 [Marchantia paleacea]
MLLSTASIPMTPSDDKMITCNPEVNALQLNGNSLCDCFTQADLCPHSLSFGPEKIVRMESCKREPNL